MELTDEGDGTWAASLTVEREGYYEISLARTGGGLVPASPQYTIDVLTDQPPSVSFSKPGRDERASPIEEFYLEATADDDYGVSELLLMYSVNGSPEDTVRLFDDRSTPEVTAGHTLFLEEFGLESGDLVAYYAQVEDSNPGADSRSAKSDIYFLQIRPFRVDFRQAEQGGGGGGGGGGGQEERALSELQEQVVAATYNLVRDRERYSESEFRENLVSVRLAQGRAREQVAGLLQRLTSRGLGNDPQFVRIAELLSLAIAEMEAAEEVLADGDLQEAISPELKALLQLQKAEENYEVEVSQGQQGGGGGARADDLADLFELELDKLKNQYETVERGERRQAGDQLEETMEELKELARRQQQQAERQRRAAAQQGNASGGASDQNQRELADETEAAARRLERLARDTNDQQLMDASRRLQEAAGDMRRAAAAAGSAAMADANSALDRLEDVQRRLERDRMDRLRNDVEEAQRRAEDLVREQREIEEDMDRLGRESAGPDSGPDSGPGSEAGRRLFERKEAMNEEVADLEREIDRLTGDARANQREASDRLREAATTIRDDKLKERVRYSRGLIGVQDREYTNEFEAETTRIVEELEQELERASGAIGDNQTDRRAEALDRARDLSRGAESLSRRLGERGEQGQGDQNRQGQGQQGQDQGQQGQGEQGQQGQGQQGQQGQGQQSQQGGQQGGQGGADGQVGQDQGGFGTDGGAYANSRGGRLSRGDIRQFRSEARQRVQEAIELQRILEEEDLNQQQLGEVIGALRELDRENVYLNLAELNRLQSQIVEGVRQLEFGLRRELEGEGQDRVFVSGSDEVPTGFRRLVEEYYRALSRTPSN